MEHPNAIGHRENGGISVSACYMPITEVTGIAVTNLDTNVQTWKSVEPANLWDAFNHPMIYLDPAQVEELGVK